MELAGLSTINEIIKTCLYTSLLDAKHPPVSLLLVAPSGGGKSLSLLRWRAPWIHHTNDITSGGLFDILEGDTEDKVRTIILPDFNVPLSHKSSVSSLTMSNLLSLMSEGVARIDDGRKKKEIKHRPISVVSAVTPSMHMSHQRKWRQLGIIRRFLTVNYRYSNETTAKGMALIQNDSVTGSNLPEIQITPNGKKPASPHIPDSISSEIKVLATTFATQLGFAPVRDTRNNRIEWKHVETMLPFSPYIVLKNMARAHALTCNRYKVSDADLKFLIRLLDYTDPANPGII